MICKKCNIEKNESLFSFKNKAENKRYTSCKPCVNKQRNDKRRGNRKAEKLKERYKLTIEQYQEMLGRGCYVCGSFYRLTVDHDHSCCSGKNSCGKCIRGILCNNCNTAEGLLGSDPKRIKALANYLLHTTML